MANFFAELKRRHIFSVAIIYVFVARPLLKFVDSITLIRPTPIWVSQTCFLIFVFGFPLAIFFAWRKLPLSASVLTHKETRTERTINSLDNPPIVISQKGSFNLKIFILAVSTAMSIALLGARQFLWALNQYQLDHLGIAAGAMGLLLGIAIAAKMGLRMAYPNYIRLDKDGLVCRSDLRTRRFTWNDFSKFEIDPGDTSQSIYAVYSDVNQMRRLPGETEYICVWNIDQWEIDLEELVQLLNTACSLWKG